MFLYEFVNGELERGNMPEIEFAHLRVRPINFFCTELKAETI
ncbi:hypothetical protein NBRC116188_07650 [Oceaniserpentilla sp. 4NH20-0058]